MQKTSKSKKRRIVTEDIFSIKTVGDAQVSEDGTVVAFIVADGFREGSKRARANIWLAELDEEGKPIGRPRQFTTGKGADTYPRWSPTGDRLAFFSDRADGEKFQVYVMDKNGGEAVQLTDLKGDIGASVFTPLPQPIVWSPDGKEIAFLMWDPLTPKEAEEKKRRGDVVEFEKVPKYCQIWTVDVKTKEARRRTDGTYQVWEFDWSKDGKKFAAITSSDPYEWSWYEAKLAVISAQTGKAKIVYDPHPRQIARPLWSLDGASLFFISSVLSDRNVVAGDLFSVREDGRGGPTDLVKGYKGSISWMEWLSPTELLLTGIEGVQTVFATVKTKRHGDAGAGTEMQKVWSGEVTLSTSYWRRFSLSRKTGLIAVGREDLKNPLEAWVGKLGPKKDSHVGVDWTQLTEINRHVQDWDAGEIKPLEWDSNFDGRTTKIQGFLMLPTEASRSKKIPLVVIVHGGPTQCNGHRYYFLNAYGTHLMAANGFAVLLPNPRGSYGRGLRFAEANVKDLGGGDFADIMAGVDKCLAMGIFDPKRVFIMGGSYGGFMTAWAVTQTNRFRAAIMQWGISNWLSFHGTTDIPLWDSMHYRSDPYDPEGLQYRFSPMAHIKRVKTPTLVVNGGEDSACPPTQSHEFFRALKEKGVETELVIYPGEGHGLTQRAHVLDALNRYLDWFKKH
jgi:dipeptidyl aminopeptidase/acylaminoacyl peptidase